MTVSGGFEEWISNGVKKRHPEWFADADKALTVKRAEVAVKEALTPVSVRLDASWDGAEPESDEYWK